MMDGGMMLRSAFWSGYPAYRKWRGIVLRGSEGHIRVFVQAFLHLPMDWLIEEIGEEKFISIWPAVRKGFAVDSPFEKTVMDAWDAIRHLSGADSGVRLDAAFRRAIVGIIDGMNIGVSLTQMLSLE